MMPYYIKVLCNVDEKSSAQEVHPYTHISLSSADVMRCESI